MSRSTCLFVAAALLLAVTSSQSALLRPEVRRAFDLVDRHGHRNVYRVNVQVVNGDSLPVSVLFVPYDQIDWVWSLPQHEEYHDSYLDIRGSARGGTGMWKEITPEEVWNAPSDRIWAADCELGGIESGAMLDIVFFAEVDDTIDVTRKPLRIGCGSCGDEKSQMSEDYWSSVSDLLLRKTWGEGALHRYRYIGYGDTLALYNMDGARVGDVSQGWEILEQDSSRALLVSSGGSREVEFTIEGELGHGSTGLLSWHDGSEGVNHGFVFGPGTGQYALLHPVVLVKEPGWSRLGQGLSLVFVLVVLMVIVLRLQRPRKR